MSKSSYRLTIVGLALALGLLVAAAPAQAGCSCTCSGNYCGGDFGDTIEGDAANNCIDGKGGADTLYGYAGDDILLGGTGGDTLKGGSGDDCLDGGDGSDNLQGESGAYDECWNGESHSGCETIADDPEGCSGQPSCLSLHGTSCSGGSRECDVGGGDCGSCLCGMDNTWICTL